MESSGCETAQAPPGRPAREAMDAAKRRQMVGLLGIWWPVLLVGAAFGAAAGYGYARMAGERYETVALFHLKGPAVASPGVLSPRARLESMAAYARSADLSDSISRDLGVEQGEVEIVADPAAGYSLLELRLTAPTERIAVQAAEVAAQAVLARAAAQHIDQLTYAEARAAHAKQLADASLRSNIDALRASRTGSSEAEEWAAMRSVWRSAHRADAAAALGLDVATAIALAEGDVTLVDRSSEATARSRNPITHTGMFGLSGVAFACLALGLRSSHRNRIGSAEDISELFTDLPVYCFTPLAAPRRRARLGLRRTLQPMRPEDSAEALAILRELRELDALSIALVPATHGVKTVGVSMELAVVCSRLGTTPLVSATDRNSLAMLPATTSKPTLNALPHALATGSLHEFVTEVHVAGGLVNVVGSPHIQPWSGHPQDFTRAGLAEIMQSAATRYGLTILATPSVQENAEALTACRAAAVCLVVATADLTTPHELARTVHRLELVGSLPVGIVLTGTVAPPGPKRITVAPRTKVVADV
jgi:hypothetical protein